MNLVSVKDLHKSYGAKEVLKGINFEINKGEIVAIVGPNGTGKTTTLEILMTLRKFDKGEVKILGVSIPEKTNYVRSRIGVVLQEGGMYNYMKIKEALDLFGSFYGVNQTRINEIVKEFELEPYMNTKFCKLSGGWKQRCLLAITFLHEPELIFLDEPTTGLDPRAAKIVWDKINSVKSKNCTIILTTHSMEEIDKFCDRAIILNEGVVVADDSPSKLKAKMNREYFNDVYFDFVERRIG